MTSEHVPSTIKEKCNVTKCPELRGKVGAFCERHQAMWMEAWPEERVHEWEELGRIGRSEFLQRFMNHSDREYRDPSEIDDGFHVGDHVEDMQGDRSVIIGIAADGEIATD